MSIREISLNRTIKEGFLQAYYIKDNLEILLSTIKKDVILDSHNHPHIQFGYCFSGKFIFNVNGKGYEILPGGSYLLDHEIIHSADAVEDFYALDFKYNGPADLDKELELNVLTEVFRVDEFIVSTLKIGNKQIFKIQGTGNFDLAKFIYVTNRLFIMTADKAEILEDGVETSILPMKIYEMDSYANLKIKDNKSEIFIVAYKERI